MTTRSYSDLQTIGRCPMKYKYRNVLKIQRRRRDTSLSLGIMVHRLLMAHYLHLRVSRSPPSVVWSAPR
jgi:hypothetical protein